MGPRTMTNSEMQDRTMTGRDQHHSVGSCDLADLTDCCRPSRWSGFTATTNAVAATGETRVACERTERTRPTRPGAPYFNDRGAVGWYPPDKRRRSGALQQVTERFDGARSPAPLR
jgi:hypothetical protein